MELLAGADTPERLEALDTLSHGLPLLSVDVRVDFRQAAGIYQAARRRGHTVRSLVDCLIASVAMRHDVPVCTRTGTPPRSLQACRSANTAPAARRMPATPIGDRRPLDVPPRVCACTHPVEGRRA